MKNRFVILHLSDAHIGKSFEGVDETTVLDPLYDDIAGVHENEQLTPDLVVFSGDLVQGCFPPCEKLSCVNGKPNASCKLEDQYKRARAFVKRVFESAGAKLGKTPLLIVPGNHDVNRNQVSANQRLARGSYDANFVQQLQTNKRNDWLETVRRQERWFTFAKGLRNARQIKWDEKFCVPWGILKIDGRTIGVMGLNTSWCACEGDESQLWIGSHQFESLYQKIKNARIKIVASHHPFSWLNEKERVERQRAVETCFDIFFHGHEHSDWFDDGAGHLRVEGGAAYAQSDEKKAYSWLEIDLKAKTAKIHARTYSHEGAKGWVPENVPGKIKDGIGEVHALFAKDRRLRDRRAGGPGLRKRISRRRKGGSLGTTAKLIKNLSQDYKVRWEPQQYRDGRKTQIFWPVRLRQPTAIHASQCFVAAALQKTGCSVNLFIDEFAAEHAENDFMGKIRTWLTLAGGNFEAMVTRKYSEVAGSSHGQKMEALETLLRGEVYTDRILKISKLWHPSGAPKDIVSRLRKRRPRRLLAPAMTWTCLRALCEEDPSASIITLGGYDERILWETWRSCFGGPDSKTGHLYLSELKGLNMEDTEFNWASREDIQREFRAVCDGGGRRSSPLETHNKMIPWCINNCALIPRFVTGRDTLKIGGKSIDRVEAIKSLELDACLDAFVDAVAEWVL